MLTSATSTTVAQVPSTHTLIKTASGEYTAASVASNPGLSAGLIKVKDGNYMAPIVPVSERFPGLESALTTLKHGG